jgi:hypothetical protein
LISTSQPTNQWYSCDVMGSSILLIADHAAREPRYIT